MRCLHLFCLVCFPFWVMAQCQGDHELHYDGMNYPLVSIGTQCWFAQNLSATHFSNGDLIPVVDDPALWNAGASANASAVVRAGRPLRTEENVARYGLYYSGHVAIDSRGVCPAGWHVPTHEDWIQLEIALGCGEEVARKFGFRGGMQGDRLRVTQPELEDWVGSNSFGWSALAAGFRTGGGSDSNFGDSAYFWSSTKRSASSLYIRGLTSHRQDMYSSEQELTNGCSIRCLMD